MKTNKKDRTQEINYLNIQIIISLIVIITVITSIILTYNEKLELQNKKTFSLE